MKAPLHLLLVKDSRTDERLSRIALSETGFCGGRRITRLQPVVIMRTRRLA